jgi:hypothetical protein
MNESSDTSSLNVADANVDGAPNPDSLKNLAQDFDIAFKRWEKRRGLDSRNNYRRQHDYKSRRETDV